MQLLFSGARSADDSRRGIMGILGVVDVRSGRVVHLSSRAHRRHPDPIDYTRLSQEHLSDQNYDRWFAYGRSKLANILFSNELARRLVERGVRFIELTCPGGNGDRWDQHNNLKDGHTKNALSVDQPISGLLTDLKLRGLLDSTLVIWGGEFGRTPMSEKGDGRDHNPSGFTMWMAGGGVRGGQTIGSTDEVGLHAVEDRLHVHDLHATVLHLLGIDHRELIYMHKGRPERIDVNEGMAYRAISEPA